MLINYILDQINSVDGTRGSRKKYHDGVFYKISKQLTAKQLQNPKVIKLTHD